MRVNSVDNSININGVNIPGLSHIKYLSTIIRKYNNTINYIRDILNGLKYSKSKLNRKRTTTTWYQFTYITGIATFICQTNFGAICLFHGRHMQPAKAIQQSKYWRKEKYIIIDSFTF